MKSKSSWHLRILLNPLTPTILIFVSAFIWIFGSWPGTWTQDSIGSVQQIESWEFKETIPIFYTLLIYVMSFFGNFYFMVPIFHISILLFSIFSVLRAIFSEDSLLKNLYILLIVLTTPFVGAMGVTIWKDILSTSFLLLGLSFFLKPINDRSRFFFVSFFWVISSLTRFENIFIISIFLAAMLISSRIRIFNHLNRIFLVCTLLTVILFTSLFHLTLNTVTKADHLPPFFRTSSYLMDLVVGVQYDPTAFSVKTREFADAYFTDDQRVDPIDCRNISSISNLTSFDLEYANEESITLLKTWLQALKESPTNIIQARACRTAAFLPPGLSSGPRGNYWIDSGVVTNSAFELKQARGPLQNLVSEWKTLWSFNDSAVAWPGLHVFSLFVFLFLLPVSSSSISQNKRRILLFWVASQIFIINASTPSHDFRFAFMLQILNIIVITNYMLNSVLRKLKK